MRDAGTTARLQRPKPPPSLEASAPGSWVRHLAALLGERGIESEPLFQGYGIDSESVAEGDDRVDLASFAALVSHALHITGEPGLGLDYGLRGRISNFGILGYALLSARDLRQAIEFVSRYYRVFYPAIRFEFDIAPPQACATVVESAALGRLRVFAHESALACTVAVAGSLLERPLSLNKLTLCYPEPAHSDRYPAVFGCRPEFDAPFTSIGFESESLDAPLKLSNREMAEICRQYCET